jgi:cephalosporin hydroxylase
MLKSYEAIYHQGQLQWVHQPPPQEVEDKRVLVILDSNEHSAKHTLPQQKKIQGVLTRTRGAMGKASRDTITKEIRAMRKEWDRK